MAKEEKNEMNQNTIFKLNGRNNLIDVENTGFNIGKVKVTFLEYAKQGTGFKATKRIVFFLSFEELFALKARYHNGSLERKLRENVQKSRATKSYVESLLYLQRGSTVGGKLMARTLTLTSGTKKPWVLIAEQGPGKKVGDGLVTFASKENREKISLAMDAMQFAGFLETVAVHIQAYLASQYANGNIKTTWKNYQDDNQIEDADNGGFWI